MVKRLFQVIRKHKLPLYVIQNSNNKHRYTAWIGEDISPVVGIGFGKTRYESVHRAVTDWIETVNYFWLNPIIEEGFNG